MVSVRDPLGCWLELGVSQREELCLLTQEVIAAPMMRAGRGVRGSRNGAVPYDTRGEGSASEGSTLG